MLRCSLIPQMVETLGRNHARQVREAAFFEAGRIFFWDKDVASEAISVSLGLMGPIKRTSIDKRRPITADEMFFWMKGLVGALLDAQGLHHWHIEPVEAAYLEKGHAVSVFIKRKKIGIFGLLNSTLRAENRFSEPVAVGELQMDALIARHASQNTLVVPSIYPAMDRDIALIAPTDLLNETIESVMLKAAPKELESIELFDIYAGKNIEEGHRSLAYSLVYRATDRTMTDTEVNAFHEAVKTALRSELHVEIREG